MARIYAASLSDYNAGRLHGTWIDVEGTTDPDEIRESIRVMLEQSPEPGAEEYEIHDHEGWEGLDPAGYSLDELPEIARGIDEHGRIFTEILTGGLRARNHEPTQRPTRRNGDQMTYRIVRVYRDGRKTERVKGKTNLTLAEAQAHCRDPETSSSTAKSPKARSRTEKYGPWFEGYEEIKD